MSDFRKAQKRFVSESEDADSPPPRFTPEFFSDLSHELRAPATSLQGYISYLLDGVAGDVTPVQREFLERAGVNASRLLTLIGEVVDLFRAEAGGAVSRRESFSLADEVRAAVGSLGVHPDEGAIELMMDAGAVIWADRQIVRRTLTGIFQRSLAKIPGGTRLRVHMAARPSAEALLTISPTESVATANDNRSRGSFETTLSREVSDVELSVMQVLVKVTGGRLWVETAIGGHPAICLALPVANREATS